MCAGGFASDSEPAGVLSSVSHSPAACGSLYLFRGVRLSAGQSVDSCCLNSLACSVNEKCAPPQERAGGKTDILWENDKNKHPFRLQF